MNRHREEEYKLCLKSFYDQMETLIFMFVFAQMVTDHMNL